MLINTQLAHNNKSVCVSFLLRARIRLHSHAFRKTNCTWHFIFFYGSSYENQVELLKAAFFSFHCQPLFHIVCTVTHMVEYSVSLWKNLIAAHDYRIWRLTSVLHLLPPNGHASKSKSLALTDTIECSSMQTLYRNLSGTRLW